MAPRDKASKLSEVLSKRIHVAREHAQSLAPSRDECYEFYRGNQHAYLDDKGKLQFLPTTTSVRGTGKPSWKERRERNLIFDVVLRQKSLATQRFPSYSVMPSTSDSADVSAAKLAEKVAIFGHDRWRIRTATGDAVVHALVGGEAFGWPYFDNTIGPFLLDEDGEDIGMGDIRIAVFGSNDVYWQPGLPFEQSPFHVVEKAQTISEIEAQPDYILKEGTLSADAASRQMSHRARGQGSRKPDLALVTHYLERPSPQNPEGVWITIANDQRIVPDKPYPGDGQEPCLRKLSYADDPDADRDISLVSQLISAQRHRNDADNRAIEWMRLCLMPRIVVPPGLMKKQRWTDEPGKVYEIPQPEQNFKVVDTPTVPKELFEISDRATADIGKIAAQNDIPSQVEAGKAIEALLESDQSRLTDFIGGVAEWYSQIMHDCLVLVQKHYTEPRLLKIRGDFGWESIKDFQGSQLRDQVDIKVFAESIEPQTKEALTQRVMNYAQLGWIGPEDAMTAIETGTTERVLRSLAQDEARIGRVIERLKEGPDALAAMPDLPTGRTVPATDEMGNLIVDPNTGQPRMEPEIAPGWMPRYSDNLAVWRVTLSDWMKTEEFEGLEPDVQMAAAQIFAGVQELEAQQMQEQMEAQQAQAQEMGTQNATRPAPAAPLPSLPGGDGGPRGGDPSKTL